MCESWGYDQAEMVQSEKADGFLTCSNCRVPLIEKWSWSAKCWQYCPICGRQFKGEKERKDNAIKEK